MSIVLDMIKSAMEKQEPFPIGGNMDYETYRRTYDDPAQQMPAEKSVAVESLEFCGVPCELLTPENRTSQATIFYIHGGGFYCGSVISSRGYGSTLAHECGMRVITITYRLAPENKWPAASDDCLAVYQAILARYPGQKIALVGESGGGNLALVTALRAKAAGIQMPACILTFSASTSIADDFPSRKTNEGALVVPYADVAAKLRDVYLDDETDSRNPFVSPFYGDYLGFPPVFCTADEGEVMFDDTALLVPKLRKANVDVIFQPLKGTFHSFPTLGKTCPESEAILKDTVAFLKKHAV